MKAPPYLPEETLRRVLRVARFDGLSVLVLAGLFALISALFSDGLGAVVGLLVAGAGAVELHGAKLLEHGAPRGINWLVSSQMLMLAAVLGYCGLRLLHPAVEPWRAAMTDDLKSQLEVAGWTEDAFIHLLYTATYMVLAVLTFIYQGAMTVYYLRRRESVTRALEGGL